MLTKQIQQETYSKQDFANSGQRDNSSHLAAIAEPFVQFGDPGLADPTEPLLSSLATFKL